MMITRNFSISCKGETIVTFAFVINLIMLSCLVFAAPIDNHEIGFNFGAIQRQQERTPTPDHCSSYHRFDKEARKCIRLGDKGDKSHCGRNMIFTDIDGAYGECDCDFYSSVLPLVYHEASKQCFPTYTRAFCGPGKWLMWSGNDIDTAEPTCTKNRCQDVLLIDPEASSIIVEYQGRCVPLHSRNSSCKSGEVVTFLPEEINPTCAKIADEFGIGSRAVYKTKRLACRKGSRRDRTGKCRQVVEVASLATPQISFPDDRRR